MIQSLSSPGYIGGAVLARLLEDKKYALPKTHITVLTRSGEKARRLRAFGLEPVVGSLDDLKTLEEIATKSDVVIQCVSDHVHEEKGSLTGLYTVTAGRRRSHAGEQGDLGWLEKKARGERHNANSDSYGEYTLVDIVIIVKMNKPFFLLHSQGQVFALFKIFCCVYLLISSPIAVLSDNARGMHGTDTIYYDSDPDQLETIPLTQPHRDVDLNIVAADKEGIPSISAKEVPM